MKPLSNCFTIETLYKKLEEIDNTFSCNKSLMVGKLNLKKVDGTFLRAGTFLDFCTQYNSNFKDILDTRKSFQSGRCFYMYFKENFVEDVVTEISTKAAEEVVVEEVVQATTEVIDTEETPVVEIEKEGIIEDVVEEKPATPDWKKAAGLKSKAKLEEYARQFNIELDKRKKLTAMLEDFKAVFED